MQEIKKERKESLLRYSNSEFAIPSFLSSFLFWWKGYMEAEKK